MNEDTINFLNNIDFENSDIVYETVASLYEENQQLKEQTNMYLNNEYKLKDRLEKQRKEYQETYKDVRIEIKELKEKLKASEKARKEAIKYCNEVIKNVESLDLKIYPKEFYDLLSILDIDKGEMKDE